MEHCPACQSARIQPYRYRPPKPPNPDRELCPYGLPKATHICVAVCATDGRMCLNCRLVTTHA